MSIQAGKRASPRPERLRMPGNWHARFGERRVETGRCKVARCYAPTLHKDCNGRTGMALASLPARNCSGRLVPRARERSRAASPKGHDRGHGAQAADCPLAVRDTRGGSGGRSAEARFVTATYSTRAHWLPGARSKGTSPLSGLAQSRPKEWWRSSWSSPIPNAGLWCGRCPVGCEVCRESLQ
jgi:hypothetical protein